LLVSSDPFSEDKLQITLYGPFMDKEDGQFIPLDNMVITKTIPPQMSNNWFSTLIKVLSVISAYAMIVFVVLNLILAMYTKQWSLNLLWCIINSLQMVFHIPLLSIYFPGTCSLIY